MVEAAKIAYRDFPTVVNDIPESGKTYTNSLEEYATMDALMQRAQRAIGGSSDSAQLAQSYMWSKIAKKEYDEEYQQLYHNIVILAVLAQCAIDSIKREYAVDPTDEIARIRDMSCMKKKKDYPFFMRYTHKIPTTKNGIDRQYEDIRKDRKRIDKRIDSDIICPMNYLQNHLNKIQGAQRGEMIETSEFFIKDKTKNVAHSRQMSKIRTMIEEYDAFVTHRFAKDTEESLEEITEETKILLEKLRGMKISAVTMNRLIGTSLGIMGKTRNDKKYDNGTKYTGRTLNLLYHMDRDRFLNNFKRG